MKIKLEGIGDIEVSNYDVKLNQKDVGDILKDALVKNLGFSNPKDPYPTRRIFGAITIEVELVETADMDVTESTIPAGYGEEFADDDNTEQGEEE